ncbi:hypothetical protein [Spirosoma montaniterrae]|uniref:hypothetical protein n=1 Tax=Spirosoma montaniterrae TaxID=1178516 RepID=UPI001E59F5B0|nr:hypothetical protein [Spirosoma montaniterrae]
MSLALAAITAWGQTNTSTISQTGVSQQANVSQTGSALTSVISQVGTPTSNTGNVGLVIQSGTGHILSISQNGSNYNRAGVTQTGTSPGSNTVTIAQNNNGNGNTSLRSADPATSAVGNGNWAGGWQLGSSNSIRIRQNNAGTTQNFAEAWQQGTSNEADIQQSRGVDNRAEIFQGNEQRGGGPAAGSLPTVNVTGNVADIDQERGLRNDASIRQFSNNNRGEVNQNAITSTDNLATIQQGDGTDPSGQRENTAIIEQNNISNLNIANILQLGSESEAEINQDGVSGSGGSSTNIASITQTIGSDENEARIDQSSGNSLLSERNNATIVQKGEDGRTHIRQTIAAADSKGSIEQGTGSDNDRAYIWQGRTSFATATITQNLTATGRDNIASIQQGNGTVGQGSSLSATIAQEGSRNDTRLLQIGSASSATVSQTGNNNVVTGPGLGTTPSGGEGTLLGGSYAVQNGSSHQLTITQTSPGGGNTSIFNTADVQQLGTGNVLIGMQTAQTAGNLMTVRQDGNTNQAFIQQNGIVTP